MTNASDKKRTDTASKVILASPQTIYQAFMDPKALISWLPPDGMKGRVDFFDPREGGAYQISLVYITHDRSQPGKTSEDTDVVRGTFLKLEEGKRIVQQITFESEDPAFAGEMIMTWNLDTVPEGTKVTIVCENVPEGIRPEDHDVGLRSTLNNLAAYVQSLI
ncbi:SRPBCC family protein [Brevibacillus panacihumi]|uniref:ATPase n=1 Tax=Brevibacillus panacihumi TaxID=497735 RepID=A0A3M8C7A3_9BACL|nr:SRPBCC family protein [Brevibacillus panacihumi]RNB71277.1 ATPase [Brevibacillus panacihumi]